MLFDSYEFLFIFLPIVLLGFWLLGRVTVRLWWLTAASLFFYAWWNPYYLPLLLVSIGGNFVAGRIIDASPQPWQKKTLLITGIAGNLALLGYFKYAGFFGDSLRSLTGFSVDCGEILLPLAISFFTFQQIARLVDGYRNGRFGDRLDKYAFFVSFFPQLIAGPIVQHKEIIPQLPDLRPTARGWSVGVTLLILGLAKKLLIADSLIPAVSGVFTAAHTASHLTAGDAWIGTLAFTLQLYFDFSGYSDIAIGLGAFFGIALPINFASPYRATSIIDFWRRWHITLSRFLRDFLYIPLGGSRGSFPRHVAALMITMLLAGLWHGAGWTFVFWGGLHGVYLAVNHLWRKLPESSLSERVPMRLKLVSGSALTFLAVMIGWVFFRAQSFADAQRILAAMAGMTGGGFELFHVPRAHVSIILSAALLAWFAPNSQQILARVKWLPSQEAEAWRPPLESLWSFQPNLRWACCLALLLVCSVMQLSAVSEFLYFNF